MENLSGIVAFVRTVATGSISKAAQVLGISAPAVSKSITTLERNLGVRLLNRTTRGVALTEEGALYFERCRPLVEELQDASSQLRDVRSAPSGVLRVSSTAGFGRHCVVPLLPEFASLYPDIEVDLSLDDAMSDLVHDRQEIAIRNGRLNDRNIVARQIAPMRLIVCGSPKYFAKHPKPSTPRELAHHNCIKFRLAATGRVFSWEFEKDGQRLSVPVKGNLTVNSAEVTCFAALRGMGLAQLGTYHAAEHIKAGRLVPVLLDHVCAERAHYLCYLERRHLPQRIRVFADFICKRVPEEYPFHIPETGGADQRI